MIWTRTDGSSTTPPWRYVDGLPDGLFTPDAGFVPGKPAVIFMTGGGTRGNADPATIGMDVHLAALCAAGFSVMQVDVPRGLGNDATMARIDATLAWGWANLGNTADPPILIGVSNGWVCAIIYAKQNPVLGVVGILTVTAGKLGYEENPLGVRAHIEDAWSVTYPTQPPARFSPYDDVDNYPDLKHKVQMWYSAGDVLFVSQQMAFGQRIRAEMHNVGAYGHLGTLDDFTAPVAHVDTTKLVSFVTGLIP